MKRILAKIKIVMYTAYAGLALVAFSPFIADVLAPPAYAIPFGQGKFGADQFGSATSLSVSLGGNVNLSLASNGSQFASSGSHTVTVSTSDVIGYSLYAYAAGTNGSAMTGSASTIPASANASPAALAVNTWGYNIDGSNNYVGMGTSPALVKTVNGGPKTADATTVKYGVLTDLIRQPGSYTVSVVYTAVALNQ